MELVELLQQHGGQGIFFFLFLYLFNRQEKKTDEREKNSQERESKLLSELEKNQDILIQFSTKYDIISSDIQAMRDMIIKKGEK